MNRVQEMQTFLRRSNLVPIFILLGNMVKYNQEEKKLSGS